MALDFGTTIAILKELLSVLRSGGVQNMSWLLRRKYSGRRLREQMHLIHRDVAHQARDLVTERAAEWRESVLAADDIILDLEVECHNSPAVEANEDLRFRAAGHLVVLNADEKALGDEVDRFLELVCRSYADFLSKWMPCQCFVSVLVHQEFGFARNQTRWKACEQTPKYREVPSLLLRDTGLEPLPDSCGGDEDGVLLALRRAGCEGVRTDRQDLPPFRAIDHTTPLKALYAAMHGDEQGRDILYQCEDTKAQQKKQASGAIYNDPNPERSHYRSVVVIPIRGSVFSGTLDMGFIWLDAPKPRAFWRMFRWDQHPKAWTAGLHMLHCIADTIAIVLTTEDAIKQELRVSIRDLEAALDRSA